MNLENVLREVAAQVAGAPMELYNMVAPSSMQSKYGTTDRLRAAMGGDNKAPDKETEVIGQTIAAILPAGALAKGAMTALKQAKTMREVMSSIRADDISKIRSAIGDTLERQKGIHAAQMERLKMVDDWIVENAQRSGYNKMPGLPFKSTKSSVPEHGVLVAREGDDYRNSINSTPKVWMDIQRGLNRPHAADAAMKLQNADTGHMFQSLPVPINQVSAHALPIDSRLASLFHSLQQVEGKAYGNNQIAIDAMAEALKRGLLQKGR